MRRSLVLFALVCAAAGGAMVSASKPSLPRLGTVPRFELLTQQGQPVTDQQLREQVSVVDFIFTNCQASCPTLTANMKRLGTMLDGAPVRLVSITVDPERDTPARLSEYAGRFGADPTRWWFLTGDSREIQRVVVDGFKVQLRRDGAGIGDVMHGNWFVLVDQAGNMRGAYLATDDASLRALVDDARALAQR